MGKVVVYWEKFWQDKRVSLLPVFTVEQEGRMQMTVEMEIDLPKDMPRADAALDAAQAFAKRLEPYVLSHPGIS